MWLHLFAFITTTKGSLSARVQHISNRSVGRCHIPISIRLTNWCYNSLGDWCWRSLSLNRIIWLSSGSTILLCCLCQRLRSVTDWLFGPHSTSFISLQLLPQQLVTLRHWSDKFIVTNSRKFSFFVTHLPQFYGLKRKDGTERGRPMLIKSDIKDISLHPFIANIIHLCSKSELPLTPLIPRQPTIFNHVLLPLALCVFPLWQSNRAINTTGGIETSLKGRKFDLF